MMQLTLFAVFTCLLQVQYLIAKRPTEIHPDVRFTSRTNSPLDCTRFANDYEILSSFSFLTYLNPLTQTTAKTYGMMDDNDNVYMLNVANQKFLPTTVFCLKSLKELLVRNTNFYQFDLDDDSVRPLPSEIELLAPTLRIFRISDTTVTHLPDQIGTLINLQTLELLNTQLLTLPNSIGNLSSLTQLSLANNRLTSIPVTIRNLRTLTEITLSGNLQLRSIQSLNGLPSLSVLYTVNCSIERLPLDLPKLYVLHMSNNNLTDLVGIRTWGNNTIFSKVLRFDRNRIQLIPPQIRHVRTLFQLDLRHNELITLPSDIYSVTTLRYLDIRDNIFSGTEIKEIIAKFNSTIPKLVLSY